MRTFLLAASLTAALGAASPAVLAAPLEPAPVTQPAPVTVRAPADDVDADAARYAAEEAANPKPAEFTGGATVVITGGALIIAALLVLLLL
jgi:hypothetical protein